MGAADLTAHAHGGHELSLSAAARERPNHTAVITTAQSLSFADLRAWVRQTPRNNHGGVQHFRAPADLSTLSSILAALETRTTFLPLHPHLSDMEARQLVHAATGFTASGAALLATSGSSGAPKLAILDHAALCASARASEKNLGYREDDCWLLCMPLAHAGGLSIVTRCLLARMPILLLNRFDPDEVLHAISQHHATLLSVVPAMLDALMRHDSSGVLSSLRIILVGGAPFPAELRRQAHARDLHVLATYGCTEMASQIATQRPRDTFDPNLGDSGYALEGAEIRIGDGNTPPGEPGPIQVRGPMRMRGYVGQPPVPPDAWFDTRDLGSVDATGRLHVVGRSDDMIITGGENVHPADIEATLATDPDLSDVLVLGLEDPHYGQIVAALFVLAPGSHPESVLTRSADRLASFKKPRRHLVVDAIPRNALGKPDRGRARLLFEEQSKASA